MSNQAENRSHHEKEEYTGVVNLSGEYNLDLLNSKYLFVHVNWRSKANPYFVAISCLLSKFVDKLSLMLNLLERNCTWYEKLQGITH